MLETHKNNKRLDTNLDPRGLETRTGKLIK